MTSEKAKKLVLLAIFIAGGLAFARAAKEKKFGELPRILVGVGMGGVFLSILAEFIPQVAGPFAVLFMTSAVFLGDRTDELVKSLIPKVGKK